MAIAMPLPMNCSQHIAHGKNDVDCVGQSLW